MKCSTHYHPVDCRSCAVPNMTLELPIPDRPVPMSTSNVQFLHTFECRYCTHTHMFIHSITISAVSTHRCWPISTQTHTDTVPIRSVWHKSAVSTDTTHAWMGTQSPVRHCCTKDTGWTYTHTHTHPRRPMEWRVFVVTWMDLCIEQGPAMFLCIGVTGWQEGSAMYMPT